MAWLSFISNKIINTALQHFNACGGHYDGLYFLSHNSPTARARELFKPSTDP